MKTKISFKKAISRELYVFSTIGLVAGSVFGLYYGIFLYKNTLDIKILVIDTLLVAIAGWVGYVLGILLIHNAGYLRTLKFSFMMLAAASLLTLVLIESIRTVYPLISIARGVPLGISAAVLDTFLLKEMNPHNRGRFFNINLSIEFISAVIMPLLIGAIITYAGGYKATFLLSALLYLLASLAPLKYNKRPKSQISVHDEIKMLTRRGIKEFNFNTLLTTGMDELNVLLIAIVPFLLLKTEFKVGIVTSMVAVIAAITALISRNYHYKRQIKLGYLGNTGRLISNTLLAIFWSPVALVFQSLVNKGLAAFNDPVFRKLRLSSAEEVLGSDLNKEALELNLVTATMTLIGQSMAMMIFLVILSLSADNQISTLRYLLVVYGVWKILNYLWVLNMRRRFRYLAGVKPQPAVS
jgi:hypothetical protein